MDPFLTNQIFPMESSLALSYLDLRGRAQIFLKIPPKSDPFRKALSYLDEMQTDRLVPSEVLGCRVEMGRWDFLVLRGRGVESSRVIKYQKAWVINDLYKWDDPPSNHPSFAVHTTYYTRL